MKNSELNPNLGGRFRGLFCGQGGVGGGTIIPPVKNSLGLC